MKNMVASVLHRLYLDLDIEVFEKVVQEIFGEKAHKLLKKIWKQLKLA